MKHRLILFLSLSFLTGCSSLEYSSYTGSQVWPTTREAVADKNYAAPVYRSWPERPYRVLGSIESSNLGKWKSGDTTQSSQLAKAQGGDALIVLAGDEAGIAQSEVPAMKVFPSASTRALVIQWKPQNEVEEESHRLDGLKAYIKRSYPALRLGSKDELWEMSIVYVTWLGLDIHSPHGAQKVEEVLSSLVATPDADSSKWLFKGILKTSSGKPTQTVVYGIGIVNRKDVDVSIVSESGSVAMSFIGKRQENGLRGKLDFSPGVNSFKGEAEGSTSPEKILLNSQWQSAGKPVRATFTFLQ